MIGLTSVTFREKAWQEVLDIASQAEIDVIEWGSDVHVKEGLLEQAQIIGDSSRNLGIEPFSYGTYYRLGNIEADIGKFKTYLETARALGAKVMRIWLSNTMTKTPMDQLIQNDIDELKVLCELAEENNITIGLEYHRNTLSENATDLLHIMDSVGASNLKTYWQMNPELTLEEHIEEIQMLKPYICCVHTFYWEHKNGDDVRLPISKGLSHWKAYIEELGDLKCPLIIEFVCDDSEQEFYEDVINIKELMTFVNCHSNHFPIR